MSRSTTGRVLVKALQGAAKPSSVPSTVAPRPFTSREISQQPAGSLQVPSGVIWAGDVGCSTSVEYPVDAKVPVPDRVSGKESIFLTKPAALSTDSSAKYHSA